jgi:hypothetical protein
MSRQNCSKEADRIVLEFWNGSGVKDRLVDMGATDGKAYRALVKVIEGLLEEQSPGPVMFETVIGYLEEEKKPMFARRSAISNPTVARNHTSEIAEIDRQVNEIDLAIKVLKGRV